MKKVYLEKILFFSLGSALILYPLIYWGYYAGDAILHLIFGQNAAHGHLFEFNLGQKSSGESSVGYMLFVGLLFRLFPAAFVPVVIKIINYLSWIFIVFVFYRLLRYKNFNKYIIAAALFALGFLPGSVYNSNIGMENGLFGLIALLWFTLAIRCNYFALGVALSRKEIFQEIILGFLMGVATWFRPEALPFFSIAIISRFVAFMYHKQLLRPVALKSLIGICAYLLPVFLLTIFIYWQTGVWDQGSVIARIFFGRMESLHFGFLMVDLKILTRLFAYFPITIFWILGIVHFFKSDWQEKIDEFFAIFLFVTFIFIFTFITGAAHLGRYMIFLTPFWILIAARGIESGNLYYLLSKRAYVVSITMGIVALAGVYSFETYVRFGLGNDRDLILAINSPQNMQKASDALYEKLRKPILPVILAEGEVDDRYRLDNRFIILSLDGRTDSTVFKYFHQSSVDYIGYLKERGAQYIALDYCLPSFQHTLPKNKLLALKQGKYIDIEGLRFTYIGINESSPIFSISKIPLKLGNSQPSIL